MLKVERGTRDNRIFSVVSVVWHPPLVHVVTLTKSYVTSQITKKWALSSESPSPSPVWWSSNHVHRHKDVLRATTTPWLAPEGNPDHQDRLGAAKHQE